MGVKASNCLQHLIAKPPTITSQLSTLKRNENSALKETSNSHTVAGLAYEQAPHLTGVLENHIWAACKRRCRSEGWGKKSSPLTPTFSLSSLCLLEMESLLAGYRWVNRASGGGQSLFILFLEGPVLVTINIEMLMLALTFLSNFLFPEKSSLTVPLFHQDLQYHCLSL